MRNKQAKINYADLWGLREEKYRLLEGNDVNSTKWQELQPKAPYYFLVPKNFRSEDTYRFFVSIADIFQKSSSGVKTHRDHFIVDYNRDTLKNRISTFINTTESSETLELLYKLPETTSFKLKNAVFQEKKLGYQNELLREYLYKPFDSRYIYYSKYLIDRDRRTVLGGFIFENIGIVLMRKIVGEKWEHAFVTDDLVDINFYGFQTYVFPLYLYGDKVGGTLFENELSQKRLNLKVEFVALLNQTYNPQPVTTPLNQQKTFDIAAEQIFYYIYSILYSNIYRQKYQEFLKIDFPRIPFTKDYNLFQKLAELGEQLVNFHLLKSPQLNNPISKFNGNNGNRVEKREYREKEKRVYINNHQYFSNIELNVWSYYIGGYQVLEKWLKDRKGRTLSAEDIKHYCKVATVLAKTITIQKQIDELYPEVEEKLA